MIFDNVSLEIHGLATFSLNPREGCIVSLINVADVTSARMDPTQAAPSDQTVTLDLVATPAVAYVLRRHGTESLRVKAPCSISDEYLWVDAMPTRPEPFTAWILQEKIRLQRYETIVPARRRPFMDARQLRIVERGVDGTKWGRIDMPVSTARYVWPDRASEIADRGTPKGGVPIFLGAPASLSGLSATYRLHKRDGTTEVLLRGSIRSFYDSGDEIQLTISSDLKQIGDTAWPTVRALYPYSNLTLDRLPVDQPDNAAFTLASPYPDKLSWTWGTTVTRPMLYSAGMVAPIEPPWRGWGAFWRHALFSTGPVSFEGKFASAGSVVRGTLPGFLGGNGAQAYNAAEQYGVPAREWNAVALCGGSGFYAQDPRPPIRPTSGAPNGDDDAGPNTYVMLRPSIFSDMAAGPPTVTAFERTHGEVGWSIDPDVDSFGYEGAADWGDAVAKRWVFRDAKNGTSGELKSPGAFAPTMVVCLPTFVDDDLGYFLSQLRGTMWENNFGVGLPAGTVSYAELAQEISVSLGAAVSSIDEMDPMGNLSPAVANELGLLTRGHVPIDDEPVFFRSAIPYEFWNEKKLKDTFFGDLRQQLAIVFVPNAGGLRPVSLAQDLTRPTTRVIDTRNIRDRDHTIDFSFSAPIGAVNITDLPKALTKPWRDSLWNNVDKWEGQQLPASISIVSDYVSDFQLEGKTIGIKCSPYMQRDSGEPGLAMGSAFAGGHVSLMRACWTRAVENYGRPHPQVTLRVAGRFECGDLVDITLPNMPNPQGGLGVENMRGQIWEVGRRVIDGTSEVQVLLVGWHDYVGPDPWAPIDPPLPPDIPTPIVWLDRLDMSTMFQDAAGTVPVVAAGDPVGLWKNKGSLGTAGDAVQPVSAGRPVWDGESIVFDGVSSVMQLRSYRPLTWGFTVASAFSSITPNASSPMIGNGTNGAGLWNVLRIDNTAGRSLQEGTGAARVGATARSSGADPSAIIPSIAHFGSAACYIQTSRELVAAPNSPAPPTPATGPTVRLGAVRVTSLFAAGDVGDVLIFDRELSDAERTRLLRWLEERNAN